MNSLQHWQLRLQKGQILRAKPAWRLQNDRILSIATASLTVPNNALIDNGERFDTSELRVVERTKVLWILDANFLRIQANRTTQLQLPNILFITNYNRV